jgi:hypothetical protein
MPLRLMSEIICSPLEILYLKVRACARSRRSTLIACRVLCGRVQKRHSHCVDGARLKNLCPFYTTHSALFYMRRPCEINNSLYFDTLCRGKRARGGYWWWINYYMRWAELWACGRVYCLGSTPQQFQTGLFKFWVGCCGYRRIFVLLCSHIRNCYSFVYSKHNCH